ncbi:hypothetical protein TRVA0_003S03246 [Trichomonascus vanleenenianus]|uniref:uncharacterized protein n=1 Tax=Trichomonascus vanleenenianus TaxID=2268995 RepID=UPI003ECB8B3B
MATRFSTPAANGEIVPRRTVAALKKKVMKQPYYVIKDTEFTWAIEDWAGLELSSIGDAKSPAVSICGYDWTIAVYPRGAGTARGTHVSSFLHVAPSDNSVIEWNVMCTFAILIWNPDKPSVHRFLEIKDFEFSYVGELNWGSIKLYDLSTIDQLTSGNRVNITIYLKIYEEQK